MYSRSQATILDFQYLLGCNKEIIVKELAILEADCIVPKIYYFQPPYSDEWLEQEEKNANNYCKFRINMLDWNDGYRPYEELTEILTKLENSGKKIFVHGIQKKRFLEKYLSRVSLIPKMKNFKNNYHFRHNCLKHNPTFGRCALLHVHLIQLHLEKIAFFT